MVSAVARNLRETYNYQKLKGIAKALYNFFNLHQGVIMGSTAVVSKKVHEESRKQPGEIGIFRDQDAGLHYLRAEEANKVVHLDVLHQPAEINQLDVANRIRQVIPVFLEMIDRNQDWSKEEKDLAAASQTRKIHLYTAMGYGTALNPDQKAVSGTDDRFVEHVHVLAKLPPRYYGLVYCIIDEVERSIQYQGAELRPVLKIVHYGDPSAIRSAVQSLIYLPPLTNNLPKEIRGQNLFQIITSLAMQMGSIESVADFFQALSPMKGYKMGNLHRAHENLDEILSNMSSNNLIKRTLLGYSLTETGHELEEFLHRNKKELAAQIRKSIRQFRTTPARYHSFRYSHLKSKERQFVNRRKILIPNSPESLNSEIAIPETVVQAAKRSFLSHARPLRIINNDLRVYAKKSYAPVDTCLLIDCSGSMLGERIKAVGYVAEYLLLNSREKVSLVTFQEREAKVVVPFTKSYDDLHQGLAKIAPAGLTPLAHGITAALDMFKQERPRNPLLILITDGIPNYPLWSVDPIKDALKAANRIAEEKIRFVCIGIDPNHKFLPLLAEAGRGNVYVVDENDRNNMIDIINQERKQYQQHI